VEFFKKEGNEYKKMPFDLEPDNCCTMVIDTDMYKKFMENQNVPKSCPVKEVSIVIHNPVISLKQKRSLALYFICLLICLYHHL
jgi:hypothetical protein